MTGSLYSLSRKEGWRRYVEAPARERPEQLQPGQLQRLSETAREDYDEARHDWHANFGILRTPQLAAVHDELDLIVSAGGRIPTGSAGRPSSTRCRAWARPPPPAASPAASTEPRSAATAR